MCCASAGKKSNVIPIGSAMRSGGIQKDPLPLLLGIYDRIRPKCHKWGHFFHVHPFQAFIMLPVWGTLTWNNTRMGQFITYLENVALPEDPILDCPTHWPYPLTPFSPYPYQAVFPILHPKSNVNTKDYTSVYFGGFHLISLDFLFETVNSPSALLISFHSTKRT